VVFPTYCHHLSLLIFVIKMMIFIFWLLFHLSTATTDVSSCTCGFRDPRSGATWTDAIIAYANETEQVPVDNLVAEDFQHAYEKNWNARFRAGASPANVGHNDSTAPGWNGNAWTLNLDSPTREHAVVGASIRSMRRDIRYGSFEAAMGPPTPGVGGSVLAMMVEYNETQTLSINVMNADDPKDAWTSFMMFGDWRGTRSKGVNFTDFGNGTYKFPTSPWGLVPYRLEWSDKKADYFIGDALARSVNTRQASERWPSTPSTLYLRHSSIGDAYTSEGPPPNGSYARVGMLRAFFNSSLMTDVEHNAFDARCGKSDHVQCLVTDTLLRGASPYLQHATTRFKEKPTNYRKRWPAIFVASICISISTILLVHASIKRTPWKPKIPVVQPDSGVAAGKTSSTSSSTILSATPSFIFSEGYGLANAAQTPGFGTPGAVTPGISTPRGDFPGSALSHAHASMVSLTAAPDNNFNMPLPSGLWIQRNEQKRNDRSSMEIRPISKTTYASSFVEHSEQKGLSEVNVDELSVSIDDSDTKVPAITVNQINPSSGAFLGATAPMSPPKARVDYLAGLVSRVTSFILLALITKLIGRARFRACHPDPFLPDIPPCNRNSVHPCPL
jgi:hypothetical protein